MSEEEHSSHDEEELNKFQIEIQKVTNFVADPEKAKEEEQKELNRTESSDNIDSNAGLPSTPTLTSTELSVSYSDISDDTPYVHGAMLSSPKAQFHRESAIPTVVEIHDLLTTRDQTLFFLADSEDDEDSGSDLILNDEELSEQRKKYEHGQLSPITEDGQSSLSSPKGAPTKRMSSRMMVQSLVDKKKNRHKRKEDKLKKSLSERGLTFAISEGHVFFNWGAFFREYLYNFFHILILPIILWNEGISGAKSRLYWPCTWHIFGWLAVIQVVGFFYINILYFGFIVKYEKASRYSLAIFVYDILYLSRISVVAIKWAYLPPQIFTMMRKKPLTPEQFSMIHLLSGWVNHENKTGLAREIGQCCARLELDINKLKFAFRDERRQKLKSDNLCLRRRCSTYVTYGNLLVPYIVFCASKQLSKMTKTFRLFSMISSPLICICPLAARVVEFDSIHDFKKEVSFLGLVWFTLCWFNMSQNLMTLIQFCSVIALDFKRRYQFVRFSTRLIELKKNAFAGLMSKDYKPHLFPDCAKTKQGKKLLESAVIQTLDLSDAETMYNWHLLRSFFLDFGLRFLKREEAVLGYFTLSMLFIIAFYFTIVTVKVLQPNYWDVAFVIASGVSVLTPAFGALRFATRINQKVSEQRNILADKRLRLENERSSVDEKTVREMNTMRSMMNGLGNRVDSDQDNNNEDIDDISTQIEATAASIGRASLMLEKIIKLLEVDKFTIKLLGYSIDTTVTGIIAAIVGAVGFLVARMVLGDRLEGLPDT